MVLQPGTRIGPYEVMAALGAGGMGEVYRARDTRLKRDVALKVLPAMFASDPDRLARFQREAELLAALNHPHIAGIYGIEQSATGTALVLELVEGETLGDRIARGPLSVNEALTIAGQIAGALDAAHEQGVIHRDLKPSNISVTSQGVVKVLDFGLAKLAAPDPADAGGVFRRPDVTASPTVTSPAMMTGAGTLLGTAAYMAPEQARGRPVDKRVDVWAFGCVLYEMLTGRRAFAGSDMTEVLGAVIHKEPDYSGVPAQFRPLLKRCLEKDPQKRLRAIGDAISLIEMSGSPVPTGGRRAWLGWVAAAVSVVIAAVLGYLYFGNEAAAPRQVRFQVSAPPGTTFSPYFIVSPDGRHAAFHAVETGGTALWLYSLDTGQSRRLASGANGGLFWSPDSRFIVFNSLGAVYKMDISGGPPQKLFDVTLGWAGGAWNQTDEIVFGQGTGPLMRVSASGGTPTPVTELNRERQELGHGGPRFLPDGRHFIYGRSSGVPANAGVFVGSLDLAPSQQPSSPLLQTPNRPMFVPSRDARIGYVVFLRETTLLAQRFDTERLELLGEPIALAQQVGSTVAANSVLAFFSASTDVLAFRTGSRALSTPIWVDRSGRELGAIASEPIENPQNPRISPDGRKLALIVGGDLWVYDLAGRPPIKLTFGGGAVSPLWTPDGGRLLYQNVGSSVTAMRGSQKVDVTGAVLSIPADGSTSVPELVVGDGLFRPYGWSANEKDVVLTRLPAGRGSGATADIVKVTVGEQSVQPVVETSAGEGFGGLSMSPNGRWLAYTSNVTGRNEIWVRAYPGPGAPVRVSPAGGTFPVWSPDGREIYYIEGTVLKAIPVESEAEFNFKPPVQLFNVGGRFLGTTQAPLYDVSSDGRFVFMRSPASQTDAPMTIVLNWMDSLEASRER